MLVPAGGPIVPIFDGWYDNPDGTNSLCFGVLLGELSGGSHGAAIPVQKAVLRF